MNKRTRLPAKIFNASSSGYQFISSNKKNINQGSSSNSISSNKNTSNQASAVSSSSNQGLNLGPLSASNASISNKNTSNQASAVSSSSIQGVNSSVLSNCNALSLNQIPLVKLWIKEHVCQLKYLMLLQVDIRLSRLIQKI